MYRNAPIHPILRFIYLLLRIVAWLGVKVFYRRRVVLGRENLRFDGPAIIVVNHPSTLMDVLNPCVHIRQESYFLANYGLFKNPVSNWLLTRLYCIPVKRREDVAEGESRNNDEAFELSYRHLQKNGLLFVAAEGVSWMERWVRPFKTGAARIAFGAESRYDWRLGVKILPVGLSYSAPNLFRSQVIVHFGKPVDASTWRGRFETDPEQAVDGFTAEIRERVRDLVLDTRDEAGQTFSERLESLLADRFPENGDELFDFRKKLIDCNLDDDTLRKQTDAYFHELHPEGLSDDGFRLLSHPASKRRQTTDPLFLAFGFPLFLTGYLFWWLPCYLPGLLTKRMKLYVGYDSNVKMLAGLFTFAPALWVAWRTGKLILGGSLGGFAGMLGAVLLGYFAERYLDVLHRYRTSAATRAWQKRQPARFGSLMALREDLIGRAIANMERAA